MYRKLLSLAVFAGATLVLAAAVTTTPSAAASSVATPASLTAEAYWRCPSGFTFQVSGSAVHCKKPSWTETKPFMACGVPTPTLKIDLVGSTDMCAGNIGATVSVEPMCYPLDVGNGFTKRRVSGKDFCGKFHPAEFLAPNTLITL